VSGNKIKRNTVIVKRKLCTVHADEEIFKEWKAPGMAWAADRALLKRCRDGEVTTG
jgi:hypothetical protein